MARIENSVALVTGANGGIGRMLVEELVAAGARKVYACARTLDAVSSLFDKHHGKVVALAVDVTRDADASMAALRAGDINILINNAGCNHSEGLMSALKLDFAREEMDVNYFGTLRMCRAFAPLLAHNGGGTIVNVLSIAGRVALPMMASASASKAAAWSLTQSIRAELSRQKTHVMGVFPATVDTKMAKNYPPPKVSPDAVARAIVQGILADAEDIFPGEVATTLAAALAVDAKAVERQFAAYLPSSRSAL